MTIFRDQLLKTQMKVYRKNLKLIEESFDLRPSVKKYAREYRKFLVLYQSISSKEELLRSILASDVVYHGDYHTLKQSQRCVLRILREIVPKRKIILCLEMFHSTDQHLIDKFMKGDLSEKTFLRKIDYAKKWGFNWKNWQPIIALCKHHNIPIRGINSNPETLHHSIVRRDVASAKIIGKAILQNSDKLIYVVDGDYHIAPNHLPGRVEKVLSVFDVEIKHTIIYQNAGNLYWKLTRENLEDSDVLKITENSFCVMNTIPANKLQSYINWLDLTEDAYYPDKQGWTEEGEELNTNSIPELVKTICNILGLKVPHDAFNRLSIYYANTPGFIQMLENKKNLTSIRSYLRAKIQKNEGFLLEYESKDDGRGNYLIYLPNSSLNMAAEEAVHFLNSVNRGLISSDLNNFDRFYRSVITECLGFFGSMLINEKRKTDSLNTLKKFVRQFKKQKAGSEVKTKILIAHAIIQHRAEEKLTQNPVDFQKKFAHLYRKRPYTQSIISTQLGYMLGKKMFIAVKKGRFTINSVKTLFCEPFNKPNEAFRTYLKLNKLIQDLLKRDRSE